MSHFACHYVQTYETPEVVVQLFPTTPRGFAVVGTFASATVAAARPDEETRA